jgi:hypothetical protein
VNFRLVLVMLPGSLVLNGVIADWEDRQPGGFPGPDADGEDKPR